MSETLLQIFEQAESSLRAGDAQSVIQQLSTYIGVEQSDLVQATAQFFIGRAMAQLHGDASAFPHYQKAVELKLPDTKLYLNYGAALQRNGQSDRAMQAYQAGISVCGLDSGLVKNIASIHITRGELSDALALVELAFKMGANDAGLWSNLGVIYGYQGKNAEALDAFMNALEIQPNHLGAISDLLLRLNYIDISVEEVFNAHKLYTSSLAPAELQARTEQRSPGPIRIGYLSGDFRRHSVSYFFTGVLQQHNQDLFEIYCYADQSQFDDVSETMRQHSHCWRPIYELNDSQVAKLIVDDQIDVLVDLAGHINGRRLAVFKAKPAAVQVTWIGYPNTTGLNEIDYRLVDAVTDPKGADAYCSESLHRLSAPFIRYTPPEDFPPLVVRAARPVTFGSFNNISKLSDQTVALWSQVLQQIPESVLYLKSLPLTDQGTADIHRQRFAEYGVAPERILTEGFRKGTQSHLEAYGEIDIALDTYPYNGTTTTCEALLMGTPVVSLSGNTHASRVGKSLLTAVGMEPFAVESEAEFVARCCDLAGNIPAAEEVRAALFDSCLCDAESLVSELEGFYQSALDSAQQLEAKSVRRLHIGGHVEAPGWEVLDALPGPKVDHLGKAQDLSQFEDGVFSELYASHVVEHFDYRDEISQALREWFRVLKPGGVAYISVPDMDILAQLFLARDSLDGKERFQVMRMMFGGHVDRYDYHQVGLNEEFLRFYLEDAGFRNLQRVESFGLFEDSSVLLFKGVPISLNLRAEKLAEA